jgi:methylmalonyl-CoA mutase C-terminal domain/subunit
MMKKPVRVLIGKLGLDQHYLGPLLVARWLKEAGMEVVYAESLSREEVVRIAIQEDVDVIGLSIHSAVHADTLPDIARLLKEKGSEDILIVAGGIIPGEDIPMLKDAGIAGIFPPGSLREDIIGFFKDRFEHVGGRHAS